MNNIYINLPYFLQFIIINIVGLYKLIIRTSLNYKFSLNYYRSFYNGGAEWEYEHNERKKKLDLNIQKICNVSHLNFHSVLNKNIVKNNFKAFSQSFRFYDLHANTSGSSGNGLKFRKSLYSEQDTWAAYVAFRELHGVTSNDWCGYFCGNMVVNPKSSRFHHTAYTTKQLIFSQYHLSKFTVNKYISVLNNKQPVWIHGYPSFLIELVRLAKLNSFKLGYKPKLVTTGSENLSDEQRIILSQFFNCSIRDLYCQTEMVAMIYECNHGSLHVNEAFSVVDFIKSDIQSSFRIIGSNINNTVFPLFNYDTEDLVDLKTSDEICLCSSKGRLVSRIDGRNEDYIVLPTGEKIGRLDHVLKGNTSVYQAQFIQDSDSLDITLLVKVDENKYSELELKSSLSRYIKGVDIKIKTVDSIEPEANGKIKFVKQISVNR